MLAYQHAFHAGNHADVFKHTVLCLLLRHLNLKDKPYRVVDSHAGAGVYSLQGPQALKTGEFEHGIGRLWQRDDLPAPVADYVQQVRALNADGDLTLYPGSPWLARRLMRAADELRLFELHPGEHAALQSSMGGMKGVELRHGDGFAAARSQWPPPSRRSLLLIDPSYEGTVDYVRVVDMVRDALRRFAPGMVMVWYPVVAKAGAAPMVQALQALAPKSWLHARLSPQAADARGFGLIGSGVFIVNPPHTLHATLRPLLPWLLQALRRHDGASCRLEQHAV